MSRPDFGAVTIEDVARRAGVSRATASRVLGGSSHVSPAARERVVRAAATLDYLPNPTAQALATGTGTRVVIGVVSARPAALVDDYLGRVVATIAGVCATAWIGVGLQSLPLAGAEPLLELAADRTVRGLVLVNATRSILRMLPRSLSGRVVSIGIGSEGVPSIDVDNAGGATSIVAHLYESGRRRIAMVAGPRWLPCAQRPVGAYERLMADLGLPIRVTPGDFTASAGRIAAKAALQRWPDTDAVYAICDATAFGVVAELRDLGVDVPGDIAVAGFDDGPLAELGYPPLTTSTHPVELIADAAIRSLLESEPSRRTNRLFGSELVIRQSA